MVMTKIEQIKLAIKEQLQIFLNEEGYALYLAANDDIPAQQRYVELETIEDVVLSGSKLLFEIRVALRILGKNWQCENLIKGIYIALHPHNITVCELTILLMSMHVEPMHCSKPKMQRKRAIMRYIVEEG